MRFGGITKFLLALIVAAIPVSAAAQSGAIIQSGTVTAGHAGVFATQNVMQDAGTSVNGGFSSLGVTNSGSCGLGINSSATTGPYYQTCLGGSGTLSFSAFGGASAVPFNFIINGTTYQIGGSNWLSGWFDSQFCATQGSILYRSGTIWNCLAPGLSGQVLQTKGGGQNPAWFSAPGTGTVTSITAGTGLTGGTITTSGTIGTAGVLNDLALISQAQGDIYYYNGSNLVALPPGTSGSMLITQGASANPIWSASSTLSNLTVTSSFTATGLVTNADLANPSVIISGTTCTLGSTCAPPIGLIVGTTTISSGTSNGLLYDNGGNLGNLAAATNGQLVIGSTGAAPVLATLTAGTGITITNGAGSITVATNASSITNSLSGDVALNNASNYFDGPSVAQGSSGTWFVSGTVTLEDTSGQANFNAKLWDGTTVIASGRCYQVGGQQTTISLSGLITSPAGNLRISVNDPSSTSGKIQFNASGNSKDSTITAHRIY